MIYIFIVFVLSIIFIIYLLLWYYLIVDYNTNELELINSNLNIDNIKKTNFTWWKQEINNFLDLFKNNKKNIELFNIKTTNSLIEYPNFTENKQGIINTNMNNKYKELVILNELRNSSFYSLNEEILHLKEEISLLKIQLLKYKIDKLDSINIINETIKEIDNNLNIKFRYSI